MEASALEDASTGISDSKEDLKKAISSIDNSADGEVQVDKKVEIDEASSEKAEVEASALEDASTDFSDSKEDLEKAISSTDNSIDGEVQTAEKTEVNSETLNTELSVSTEEPAEDEGKSDSSAESADQILSSESSTGKEVTEQQADDAIIKDDLPLEPPTAEKELSPSAPTENEVEPDDKNGSMTSSGIQTDDPSSQDAKGSVLCFLQNTIQLYDQDTIKHQNETCEKRLRFCQNDLQRHIAYFIQTFSIYEIGMFKSAHFIHR